MIGRNKQLKSNKANIPCYEFLRWVITGCCRDLQLKWLLPDMVPIYNENMVHFFSPLSLLWVVARERITLLFELGILAWKLLCYMDFSVVPSFFFSELPVKETFKIFAQTGHRWNAIAKRKTPVKHQWSFCFILNLLDLILMWTLILKC